MIIKGKITDSLKPPLTKRLSEVSYWKLNEMPGSSECPKQKHQFLSFYGKKYEETMANEQSQNGRRDYQINEITYAKGDLLLMVDSREFRTLKPKL